MARTASPLPGPATLISSPPSNSSNLRRATSRDALGRQQVILVDRHRTDFIAAVRLEPLQAVASPYFRLRRDPAEQKYLPHRPPADQHHASVFPHDAHD